MKHIKMQDCSVNQVYSGIYKITFPNGKIYIGRSNNIYRRMLEHNNDFRNKLPIEYAIQKYGKITEFDIVEEISPENINLSREREIYWIKFYNSTNKEKGYNISSGGDGAGLGSENLQAKFTEEQIQEIYKELKENLNTSMEDIANKHNIHISTLSNINQGHTYFHSSVKYPIRDSKQSKIIISGTKNHNSNLNEKELSQIVELLQNEKSMSMVEIANKFNVGSTVIQNINSGKTYLNKSLSYPLRKNHKTGARKLTNEQVQQIIQEIKNNPKESLASISRRLNISSKTVSAINCGTIYKQKEEKYPIR